jgi:RNA polymerase sigma-70 factor (ECF subfamily)
VLYRLVGDQAEAEDLALETFWRLYTNHPKLDSQRSLGGWLYRVAVNLGFNALRSRQRRQQYESWAMLHTHEDKPEWDPPEQFEKAQEILQVRRALLRLKPRSAQLLVLRYSGLSYRELADTLSVAPGSVGTLLVRAEREFEEVYRALEGDFHAHH